MLIEPQYSQVSVRDDYAKVYQGKSCGVVDSEGREVIAPAHDDAGVFSPRVWYAKDGDVYGFISKKSGRVVADDELPYFSPLPPSNKSGLKMVYLRVGTATPAVYRWGFIDDLGRIAIEPRFERVHDFNGGFAAVEIDGECGFIDRSGRTIVPLRFAHCERFDDGMLVAVERPFTDPARTRPSPVAVGATPGQQ